MRKKFKKKKNFSLDFFLWAFHTYKKFSLEKRGKRELSIYTYIYIYIYKRKRREAVSAVAAAREGVVVLVVERNLFSLVRFFFVCFVDERISIFFSTLKLRKTFRTMREEEEQTMHATTTNTVHELRVIVRDARGMREEAPLRVHAKFDDEEKMTVSVTECISLFFCCLCALSRENLLTKEWS